VVVKRKHFSKSSTQIFKLELRASAKKEGGEGRKNESEES